MSEHNFPVHPVCELFPLMDERAFAELKADIAANGQHEPIALCEGTLIDGRNRLRACRELGIEPKIVGHGGNSFDPVKWIVGRNLYRRHLSDGQRALVAAGLANLKPGDNQHARGKVPQNCGTTQKQAAEVMNTNVRAVQLASAVLKGGCDELVELVRSDHLPLTVAESFVRLVPDMATQRETAAGGARSVKFVTNRKAKFDKRLKELKDRQAPLQSPTDDSPAPVKRKPPPMDDVERAEADMELVESLVDDLKGRWDTERSRNWVAVSFRTLAEQFAPADDGTVNVAADPAPEVLLPNLGTDPDAVALAALNFAKSPCLTIERWLKSATQDQVSVVWGIADELLADAKGGRK